MAPEGACGFDPHPGHPVDRIGASVCGVSLLVVSAVGPDRPGIVAGVTGVLLEHGGNLEDTSMTILRGHFAMTMVVAAASSAAELAAALRATADALGLLVSVAEITPESDDAGAGEPYVVAVHGADHPGIVHAVTALLAERNVNVVDLTTRLRGEGDSAVYVMALDIDIPAALDVGALSEALTSLGGELGVTVTVHAADADLL